MINGVLLINAHQLSDFGPTVCNIFHELLNINVWNLVKGICRISNIPYA